LDVPNLEMYLQRHIDVDGGEHGPMAGQMMELLIGNSEKKYDEALKVAAESIEMRIKLWDGIHK